MPKYPEKLAEMVGLFEARPDRSERIQILLGIAGRFETVPERIARRPYPASHRVRECESEAYVWAEEKPDGTLKFYFAVENPQGVSAMATSVILDETLSGAPLEEVAAVPPDVIYQFFGEELSMGKSLGLTGIVHRVRGIAGQYLTNRSPTNSDSVVNAHLEPEGTVDDPSY